MKKDSDHVASGGNGIIKRHELTQEERIEAHRKEVKIMREQGKSPWNIPPWEALLEKARRRIEERRERNEAGR